MIERGRLHLVRGTEDSAHLTVLMINLRWSCDWIPNFHAASPCKLRLLRNLLVYSLQDPDCVESEEAFAGKDREKSWETTDLRCVDWFILFEAD